jgi:hypothetical protein
MQRGRFPGPKCGTPPLGTLHGKMERIAVFPHRGVENIMRTLSHPFGCCKFVLISSLRNLPAKINLMKTEILSRQCNDKTAKASPSPANRTRSGNDFQVFMLVGVSVIAVAVSLNMQFARYDIKTAVTHTGLGQDLIGEFADIAEFTFQRHNFKAGIMINVEMNR